MILIVEDNEENTALLRLFLERKAGLQTEICTDGDRALSLCRSGKVRLVIMDIQLNNTFLQGKPVTGMELTRQIKMEEATSKIPILLATAHAMREEREQFLLASGANGYFTKPVEDYNLLIAEIRRWLPSDESSV